ncbi:type II secretion system F family protein [Massilia sp. BKSP1R2A-1]|uniref:type II secretion system F family protein n=1 Tax=Massilia sp. BKSP1R2A-1 TaxID=3422595 RepID=UPI003D3586E0
MQYRVKQLTPEMAIVDKVVDAASEAEARELIASTGGNVVAIRAVRRGSFGGGNKALDLSVFNQQMHSLLEAGQTVVDAIEILSRNDRKGGSKAVYDVLLRSLHGGKQLSVAMEGLPSVFPPLYVAMVRSSETTGTVRASIRRFQLYQQQVDTLRGKLRAAATYPAILLAVGFLVISFLMLYVLPRFSAVYEDAGTMNAGSAGFVQWWGGFVRDNEALAWGGFLVLIVALTGLVIHPAVRRAAFRKLLATPWVGERIWVLQLGRFYRTLGMLLHSGISVLAAMRMTRASLPAAMHGQLDKATRLISEGIPMSTALRDCSLGTEVAIRLLVASESSGNIDHMMNHIADFYDQETSMWVDTAGRVIEPALMLVIGLVVGAVVLMLYSPIFDLANIV